MKRKADAALEPLAERFRQVATAPYQSVVADVAATGVFELLVCGPDLDGRQVIARATVDPFSGDVTTEYLGDSLRLIVCPEIFPDEVTRWVDQFIASVAPLSQVRLRGAEGFETVTTISSDGREYEHLISDDLRARALVAKLKALGAPRAPAAKSAPSERSHFYPAGPWP